MRTPTAVFANPAVIPRGWYWALPSQDLKRNEKRELAIFGEQLVLYRGESGKAYCMEAYCAHMGAHLKEGRVLGEALRCTFHGWKYSGDGRCMDIPCAANNPLTRRDPTGVRPRKSFLVAEKFSMIWIHSDPAATLEKDPLPFFPALEGRELIAVTDIIEIRNCHPTLILGGGVDEEHFDFTHEATTSIAGPMRFTHASPAPNIIRFENVARIQGTGAKTRVLRRLYGDVLKYVVTYWNASTALAELGPKALPLYSIFAYRPYEGGRTEGLNIYLTPKRRGILGRLISKLAIAMTRKILRKGGGEDKVIQNSMRYRQGPHTFDNPPFRAFVEYVERQPFHLVSNPSGDSQP